jgi:cysteine-rich repeat protein
VAPDAEIVAVKVLDSEGNGRFSDVAAGLDWVLTNHAALGIRIVNISLGDGGQYGSPSVPPCIWTNTASAIESLHAAGVTVFVSSGNDAHDNGISFPACVAEAISVGGVYDAALGSVSWCGNATCTTTLCTDNPTAADVFVCHSNSDELLDLLAPDWRTDTAALGGGTTAIGGTSAASPYAAAEAALLLQADGSLTPEQIRSLMKTNGPAVVNPDNGLSFTRSDVAAALLAISPATCGNDVLEFGEECDDGNTADGDCCSATCQYEPPTTVCRPAADVCDVAENCDGAGACPTDAFEPATTECRAAAGVCDAPDYCDGVSAACTADAKLSTECRASAGVCDIAEFCDGATDDCPTDAFEPATTECRTAAGVCDAPDYCDGVSAACTADVKLSTECRASAGVCDIAEFCDGATDDCPTDAFEPATTECRTAAGVCDIAETCSGSEADCPNDEVLDGVACSDGDVCNGEEMCEVGICAPGTPLDCDDGDDCTADSCDEVTGCAHTPIEPCGAVGVPTISDLSQLLVVMMLVTAGVLALAPRRAARS